MASVRSIEETLDRIVTETPQGGGLMMTVNVRVYDNGAMNISGRPTTDQGGEGMVPGGSVEAWAATNEIFAMHLRLFARRVRKRINEREAA
jgi:hypothetical protein